MKLVLTFNLSLILDLSLDFSFLIRKNCHLLLFLNNNIYNKYFIIYI